MSLIDGRNARKNFEDAVPQTVRHNMTAETQQQMLVFLNLQGIWNSSRDQSHFWTTSAKQLGLYDKVIKHLKDRNESTDLKAITEECQQAVIRTYDTISQDVQQLANTYFQGKKIISPKDLIDPKLQNAARTIFFSETKEAKEIKETAEIQPTSMITRIENCLEKAVADKHFSGVVMVVNEGEVIFTRGYGMASDVAENRANTVMHVASVTKQFTAAAIMLLNEAGKVDLETSINRYLPIEYRTDDWEKVTVHHLLSHTSGIPDYDVTRDYYDVQKGFCLGYTVRGMINEAQGKILEFTPGSEFNYSNIGYTLLGAIIEAQSGKPYGEFIKSNLLIPAGMVSSGIHEEDYVVRAGDALGCRWDEQTQKLVDDDVVSLPVTAPDGGLFTTTEDMWEWSKVISGEKTGILSATSLEKMTTPVKNLYGYGLHIDESCGTKRISHPGSIVGFLSNFCLYPEKNAVIAVFCNNNSVKTPFLPLEVTSDLEDILLKPDHS